MGGRGEHLGRTQKTVNGNRFDSSKVLEKYLDVAGNRWQQKDVPEKSVIKTG